ncbi:hypothetical protein BG006_010752 [Podila minutissima]|uniref:Uncharacterized protein n=1 Tax=Podila minutissima TaxID=64525 RepID=A0A9P5VI13_9FUNG|nr:hypothetical protein BG006_010752 [Podila minutissima]
MVVHPRLVGVLLRGRSSWRSVSETDYFVLQHHPRQLINPFRIITRGFPHYRVAEGDSVEMLQDELEHLSQVAPVSIKGKVTSKKIATWLKASDLAFSPIKDIDEALQPEEVAILQLVQDEDGYLSDLSTISNEEEIQDRMIDEYDRTGHHRLRRAVSLVDIAVPAPIEIRHHHLLAHHHHRHHQDTLDDEVELERPTSSMSISLPVSDRVHPLEYTHHHPHSPLLDQYQLYHLDTRNNGSHWPETSPEEISASSDELMVHESLLEDSKSTRSMYTFQSTPETGLFGLDTRSSEDTQCQSLSGAWGWLKGSPLLDAVVSWIEGPGLHIPQKKSEKDKPNPLLDIPLQFIALLTYPELDPKTGNTASLAIVRETSFVRQRRRTLMILTAYTLVVRYCSFDFFLMVLFASNCAMLFLMKNSGRMNVNMAKRAVNQRVGWAKQWAGGFFRRGQGTQVNSSPGNKCSTLPLEGSSNVSYSKSVPSLMASTHSIRTAQTSTMDDATENSTPVKRRGFFGKRSTNPPNSTSAQSIHGDQGGVDEPTTQKRRFFKRSINNGSAAATTTTPSVPSRSLTAPPVSMPNMQFPMKSIGALPYALSSSSTVPLAPTARPCPATQSSPQLQGILTRSPSPNLSRKSNLTSSPKSLAPESIPSPVHRATSPPALAPALSLPTAASIPSSSSSAVAQGRSLSKTILASLTSSRSSSSLQQDTGRNNSSHTVVSPTASRPAVALVAATRDHGLPVEVLSSSRSLTGRMLSDEDTESDHRQHHHHQGAYGAKFSSSPETVYSSERKRSVQHEKGEHLDMLDPVTRAAAEAMDGLDREA